MLRFYKSTYLSFLFRFILSVRLVDSLWRSDVPLFLEFIIIVSILFYNFIEFIIFLYTFLVTSFSLYKEYMICLTLFRQFSDVLSAFTCVRVIVKLWNTCFGVKVLILLPFCCLLKSRISSTIWTTFFGFLFSGITLLLIEILKLMIH